MSSPFSSVPSGLVINSTPFPCVSLSSAVLTQSPSIVFSLPVCSLSDSHSHLCCFMSGFGHNNPWFSLSFLVHAHASISVWFCYFLSFMFSLVFLIPALLRFLLQLCGINPVFFLHNKSAFGSSLITSIPNGVTDVL